MSKLTVGGKLPEFTYAPPFASGVALAGTVKKVPGKTALVFLRYYGCTLCQYDIHKFAAEHDKVAAVGGQMLVVLQSDPQKLAEQIKPGDLPFDIICDPAQKLYKKFAIEAAGFAEEMIDDKTREKIAQAKSQGFQHGDYEGEELQLPCTLVVDQELTLTYVHYGTSAGDVPNTDELAGLLK